MDQAEIDKITRILMEYLAQSKVYADAFYNPKATWVQEPKLDIFPGATRSTNQRAQALLGALQVLPKLVDATRDILTEHGVLNKHLSDCRDYDKMDHPLGDCDCPLVLAQQALFAATGEFL